MLLARHWRGLRALASPPRFVGGIFTRACSTAPNSAAASTPPTGNAAPTSHPFITAMTTIAPNIHLTENGGFTHLSSLDPRLDLFSQLLPSTEKSHAVKLFEKSWAQSPLDTLKLIFHAGSIRVGKSDKVSFLNGLWWLSQKHPETLIANLEHVPQTTYWKHLLELLRRLNVGEEEFAKGFDKRAAARKGKELRAKAKLARRAAVVATISTFGSDEVKVKQYREERLNLEQERVKLEMATAREARKKLHKEMAEHTASCRQNPIYARIEDRIAELFADQIRKDVEELNSIGKKKEISLAGKWAPSFSGSFNRRTSIALVILQKLVTTEVIKGTKIRTRDQILQKYLVPLRRYIAIPEAYMSAKRWGELPYNRVPSVAMKNYKKLFNEHDQERFSQYVKDLQSSHSTKQIASGALLPHEILYEAIKERNDPSLAAVTELQWESYVDRIAKAGTLSNMLPVCDVSGSMTCRSQPRSPITCLQVAVALSLLISQVTAPPFQNLVCTFSQSPYFHEVKESTLIDKFDNLSKAGWGMNTNYIKVFELILGQAQRHSLPKEQMVKRVVVLSDMEFDSSVQVPAKFETDHMQIQQMFADAGYDLPEIIYWNLSARRELAAVPVTKNTSGVALVSGFSGNMLKLFMDDEFDKLEAVSVMVKAISHEAFDKLTVVD